MACGGKGYPPRGRVAGTCCVLSWQRCSCDALPGAASKLPGARDGQGIDADSRASPRMRSAAACRARWLATRRRTPCRSASLPWVSSVPLPQTTRTGHRRLTAERSGSSVIRAPLIAAPSSPMICEGGAASRRREPAIGQAHQSSTRAGGLHPRATSRSPPAMTAPGGCTLPPPLRQPAVRRPGICVAAFANAALPRCSPARPAPGASAAWSP